MLEVHELTRRSIQGQTKPWHCRLSNGHTYYIKGTEALHRGLIVELLCAQLGRSLGLPIPNSEIAYLDQALLKYNDEAKKDFGENNCYVFASKEMENLVELKYSDLVSINPQVAKLLFFFDYLIQNEDRTLTEHSGNPNLFLNPNNSELVVLDHNLAFDTNFNFDGNKNIHAFQSFWYEIQLDLHFRTEMMEKLPIAINELAEYAKLIPAEWLTDSSNLLNTIFITLNLYKEEVFWETLQ